MGMYTRFYARKFNKVWAFEPEPRNFHCLVASNPFDNIQFWQAALGSQNSIGWLKVQNHNNRGTHSMDYINVNDGENKLPVQVLRLDDFNLQDVDLIQLDVEGAEAEVLLGAQETIARNRPVVILEVPTADSKSLLEGMFYKLEENSASDVIFVPANMG
jgi:FkbM family methyltransferase